MSVGMMRLMKKRGNGGREGKNPLSRAEGTLLYGCNSLNSKPAVTKSGCRIFWTLLINILHSVSDASMPSIIIRRQTRCRVSSGILSSIAKKSAMREAIDFSISFWKEELAGFADSREIRTLFWLRTFGVKGHTDPW